MINLNDAFFFSFGQLHESGCWFLLIYSDLSCVAKQ